MSDGGGEAMVERVFVSGMMGTGKSTVARALAAMMGVAAIDLDARIEQRVGRSVREIFRERGEAEFRVIEAEEAVKAAMEPPTVIALGGGTVTRDDTRRLLLGSGLLVTLSASPDELVRRVADGQGRPLLESASAREAISALLEARHAAYAECHAAIDTEGISAEEVAREILRVTKERPIVVPLGARSYRAYVGSGVLEGLPARIEAAGDAVIVVTDRHVQSPWADRAIARVEGTGRRAVCVMLEPGEEHKRIGAVERIWDRALGAGIDRDALVLGVGGGVIGDLAGFAASTLLRGVAFGLVPTSLLAMVDASVGGKTGFDRAEGKNLVGTFHQPRFVLADVDALSTLPDDELRSGLAEVVKSAWIRGEEAVASLERDAEGLLARDPEATERAIRMALGLKAEIVAEDEREGGRRRLLNLGHTVGHAIEAAREYRGIRHGEAVALGMMAAFRVAAALGDAGAEEHAERMRALLAHLGLPTVLDAHLDERVVSSLASDKKRVGSDVRFVVPAGPGAVRVERIGLEALGRAVRPA
jgi:shikimate kinase/3-dehydroquinate synthase